MHTASKLKFNEFIVEILSLVVDGDDTKAQSLLKDLSEQQTAHAFVKLILAWLEYRKHDDPHQMEAFQSALTASVAPWNTFARLASAMMRANDLVLAGPVIDEAIRRDAPLLNSLGLQRRLARAHGDSSKERQLLEMLCNLPDSPAATAFLQLAVMCRANNDFAEALVTLKRLVEIYPDDIRGWQHLAVTAREVGDDRVETRALVAAFELDPRDKDTCFRLLLNLRFAGLDSKAQAVARRTFDMVDEVDLQLCKIIRYISLPKDLEERVVDCATKAAISEIAQDRATAQDILMFLGRAVPESLSNEVQRDGIISSVDDVPPDDALLRPTVKTFGTSEIVIGPSLNPRTLAFIFTGVADRIGMPIHLFDKYLAELDVTAVYVRDKSLMLFGNGLETMGGSFEATCSQLQDIASKSGAQRIVTIGNSAGGFSAIRYGLALKADAVLGFSAPTNLSENFNRDHARATALMRRLQSLPPHALDVRPDLRAQGNIRTPITLVYGALMEADTAHAKYLEAEEAVTLIPVEGLKSHASLSALAQQKQLRTLLHRVVSPGHQTAPKSDLDMIQ